MAYATVMRAESARSYATHISGGKPYLDRCGDNILELMKRTLETEYSDCSFDHHAVEGKDMSKNNKQKPKGNPFQRASGKWTYIVYEKDRVSGIAKPKWHGGFSTEAEAKTELLKAKTEITAGQYRPSSNITVEKYISRWFETHLRKLEPATIQGYRNNTNLHIIPNIGKQKLSDLNRHILTDFYYKLTEKDGLSATSVHYVHATLRKALNDAVADDYLLKNPAEFADLPKGDKYKATVLNEKQAQALFQGLKGESIETEILLMLCLGLRRGEALGLRFCDVDFGTNSARVAQQITTVQGNCSNNGQNYGIKRLKTESSNRSIPLPPLIIDSIKMRKKKIAEQRLFLGEKYHNYDLICCKDDGSPKSPQTVYHQFKKLLKALGLPDMRLHDLRHTCATLLSEQGVPLKVISSILGHSTISTTADIYTDVMEENHRSADVMQSIFGPNENS